MRQIHLAIMLFLLNTGLTVLWLWDARPRTVATMDIHALEAPVYQRLLNALGEVGLDPRQVRVCEVGPCTDGPAIFVANGTLELALLPESSEKAVDKLGVQ